MAKYTVDTVYELCKLIEHHAELLVAHDASLDPKDHWIAGASAVIKEDECYVEWHEFWQYGGYEHHKYDMDLSEVFADDPMAIIKARSDAFLKTARAREEAEAAYRAREQLRQAALQHEKDLIEYARLQEKFGQAKPAS